MPLKAENRPRWREITISFGASFNLGDQPQDDWCSCIVRKDNKLLQGSYATEDVINSPLLLYTYFQHLCDWWTECPQWRKTIWSHAWDLPLVRNDVKLVTTSIGNAPGNEPLYWTRVAWEPPHHDLTTTGRVYNCCSRRPLIKIQI